jgi:hypothetical protein
VFLATQLKPYIQFWKLFKKNFLTSCDWKPSKSFSIEFEFCDFKRNFGSKKIKIAPSPDVGRLRKNHIHLVVMPIGHFRKKIKAARSWCWVF